MINEEIKSGEQFSLASTLTIFPDNIKSISTLIHLLQGCKPRISMLIHTKVKYINT